MDRHRSPEAIAVAQFEPYGLCYALQGLVEYVANTLMGLLDHGVRWRVKATLTNGLPPAS
jgi:hypothetical protein